MAGKLNGVMPAQTPMGWRTVLQSMPCATSLSESPIIRLGMPQATSTIWMARRTSAWASSTVLPFSRVRMRGEFRGVLFEQRFEAVEHLHPIHHRDIAPFQKRLVRGADGAVHIVGGRVRHFGEAAPVAGLVTGCRCGRRLLPAPLM